MTENNNTKSLDLIGAVQDGDIKTIKLLIDEGVDVNIQDSIGRTALRYATAHDQLISIILLTDAGADPNIVDENGRTALYSACMNNINLNVVKLLIEAGADLNFTTKDGDNPVKIALMEGRMDVVGLLIENLAEADPSRF